MWKRGPVDTLRIRIQALSENSIQGEPNPKQYTKTFARWSPQISSSSAPSTPNSQTRPPSLNVISGLTLPVPLASSATSPNSSPGPFTSAPAFPLPPAPNLPPSSPPPRSRPAFRKACAISCMASAKAAMKRHCQQQARARSVARSPCAGHRQRRSSRPKTRRTVHAAFLCKGLSICSSAFRTESSLIR